MIDYRDSLFYLWLRIPKSSYLFEDGGIVGPFPLSDNIVASADSGAFLLAYGLGILGF